MKGRAAFRKTAGRGSTMHFNFAHGAAGLGCIFITVGSQMCEVFHSSGVNFAPRKRFIVLHACGGLTQSSCAKFLFLCMLLK